jgi:peptidoglycan biosynthesis protein MviN/MurJ (putative lipid II flippase)
MIPHAYRITVLNVSARAAQLLLLLGIGNRFGATEVTDTVFLLQAPLVVINSIVASTAELVVMPALHRAEAAGAVAAVYRRLVRHAVVVVVPITLAGLVVSSLWVGRFEPAAVALLLPMPILATLASLRSGLLHAHGRHARAYLGPLWGSLAGGLALVAAPLSVVGLIAVPVSFEAGRLAGMALHTRGLLPPRREAAAAPPASLDAWPARNALLYAVAAFGSSLNLLVDLFFAGRLPAGAVSQVEYASRLWQAVPLLLSGHVTLFHARWSRDAAAGEARPAAVHRAALALAAAGLAASAVLIVAAPFLIDLFYGFGRLGAEQRDSLARLLQVYLGGAWVFLAGIAYVRALSASGRAAPLAAVAMGGVAVNASLNLLLIPHLGLHGIGAATALTYLATTLTMAALAGRLLGRR